MISDKSNMQFLVNAVMLATSNNTIATLVDSGNFVLVEGESTSLGKLLLSIRPIPAWH